MSHKDLTRDADADRERDEWHEPTEPDDGEGDYLEEEPLPRRGRQKRPHRERAVVLFADQAGSIIRAGDENLDAESLPVLTAFRQFLEAERRRARRQMITLIAGFTLVLAILIGGGGWYVWTTLQRVESGLESGKVRSEEDRLAVISNLQSVARVAVTLKKDVLDTRKNSAVLQDRVAEQSGELSKLLDTITSLEIQNSRLQRSMRKLDESRDEQAFRLELEPPVPVEPPPPEPETGIKWTAPRAAPVIPVIPPASAPIVTPLQPAAEPTARPADSEPAPVTDSVPGGTTRGGVPFRLPLPRP